MRSALVKISAGLTLPVIALIVAYVASPYVAVRNFAAVAQSGDVDQIEAAVDFPRVRESLKAQFNAKIALQLQTDPAMQNNPFTGLGMMMAPAMIDQMVDAVITPEGIASMVRHGKVDRAGQPVPVASSAGAKVTTSYVTMDRFKMTITDKAATSPPIGMMFERHGLFGWRLVRVELPIPSDDKAASAAPGASPPPPLEAQTKDEVTDSRLHAAEAPSGNEQDDVLSTDDGSREAASLPPYDAIAYCRKIGDTAGGSNVIERSCRDLEARAEAAARTMTIPTRTLRYCGNIGRVAGGSYQIFKSCVDQEIAAAP